MLIIRYIVFNLGLFSSLLLHSQTALETYKYAQSLVGTGNFEQAIIELERVNLFTDSLRKECFCLMAECYNEINDPEKAIKNFREAINLENDDSLKMEYNFRIISLFIKDNEPIYSLVTLNSLDTGNSVYFTRKKLFYTLVGYFRLENYEESLSYIVPIAAYYPGFDTAYVSTLVRSAIKNKSVNTKRYSVMSAFLPGLGQMANGEFSEGLNSFALNAFLITSGITTAYRLSFFDAFLSYYSLIKRYYIGGILKAKALAKEKIETKKIELFNELLNYFETKTNF